MRPALMLLVGILGLTVILGLLEQTFSWVNVFTLVAFMIEGEGGFVEIFEHCLYIGGYIGVLVVAFFEGLLNPNDPNTAFLVNDFTLEGLVAAITQLFLKLLGVVYQLINLFATIWGPLVGAFILGPFLFVLDLTMSVLAVFNISVNYFQASGLLVGFVGMFVLFMYLKPFPFLGEETSISQRIRGFTTHIPIISDVITTIRALFPNIQTPGEVLDNALKGTIIDQFINPGAQAGNPAYTSASLEEQFQDLSAKLELYQNAYRRFAEDYEWGTSPAPGTGGGGWTGDPDISPDDPEIEPPLDPDPDPDPPPPIVDFPPIGPMDYAPFGPDDYPPAGPAEWNPKIGDQDYPPGGWDDYAPEGWGDYPPEGADDYAPPGEGDYAPPGEGDYAPEGPGDYPPLGDEDYPPEGWEGVGPGGELSAPTPGSGLLSIVTKVGTFLTSLFRR